MRLRAESAEFQSSSQLFALLYFTVQMDLMFIYLTLKKNNFRIAEKIVCHYVAEEKIVFSPEKFIHPINFPLQCVTML